MSQAYVFHRVPIVASTSIAILFCLSALLLDSSDAFAQQPGLHIIQRLTVSRPDARKSSTRKPPTQKPATPTLASQDQEIYLSHNGLLMQTKVGFILIRSDLRQAWLLNTERQPLAILSLKDIEALINPIDSRLPAFTPTGATKTVAGLPCAMHHGAIATVSVDVCIGKAIPEFERFQAFLGIPKHEQGFPVEMTITLTPPNDIPTYIIQRFELFEHVSLDPAMFTPPQGDPIIPPGTSLLTPPPTEQR